MLELGSNSTTLVIVVCPEALGGDIFGVERS
jgi:hypothetical protein